MGRRRDRPRTDDSNWGLRDEYSWYAEQAKAAPGAVRALLGVPGTLARGARDMVRDMRSSPGEIPAGDPVLEPVAGVSLDTMVDITFTTAQRRLSAPSPEVLAEHGLDPETYAAALTGWNARRQADPRLPLRFGAELRARYRR